MNKVVALGIVVLLLFAGGYIAAGSKLNDSYVKIPTGQRNDPSEPSGWFGVDLTAFTSDGDQINIPLGQKALFFLNNPSNPAASNWLNVNSIRIVPSVYFDKLPYTVTVQVRSLSVFLDINNAQKEIRTVTNCGQVAALSEKQKYPICHVDITEADVSNAKDYLTSDDNVKGKLVIKAVVTLYKGSSPIRSFEYETDIAVAFFEPNTKGDINLPRPPYPVPYPQNVLYAHAEVVE